MRATMLYGAGDVRVQDVPDPVIKHPTDAIVRVLRAAVCGSDLHPYRSAPATGTGRQMGHEFLGTVEEAGSEVAGLKRGDLVLSPFTYADNTCWWCERGLQTSCPHGGRYGFDGVGGGQGEAVRVPQADGTLVKLPTAVDKALLPSLLTLTDVFCTGHHAAATAHVRPGTSVAVVGDGAVGLCAVLAAKRLGAEQVVLMGRHTDRTDLGVEFGATDVVLASGDEGAAQVRKLTGGRGADAVLECVGSMQTLTTSFSAVRDGGVISRVGVPSYTDGPIGMDMIMRNITLTGGVDPARHYIDAVLPDVLEGRIEPGRVFDRTFPLEQTPDAYQAMADRRTLKALVTL
ncbi:zinc-binding dehydrogenase [Streptomyces sp. NBC_01483]|uniref:zinc-binding dehydrogenase n=1 Tax=Streptomyces sp. NBC_01483 TaxID=2903883 RepID=UPI002E378653|nr:alcohol dehydrogenase catalytic domain-containing protein [Streptomyces sp. NBC_01483]